MIYNNGCSGSGDGTGERVRLRTLLGERGGAAATDGVPGALGVLCDVAVETLGLRGAAVSLMTSTASAGGLSGSVVAASDDPARSIEDVEFEMGEGPGRDAFTTSRPVLTPDLDHASPRWPAYAPAAVAIGTRASFAFPMHVGVVRLGVLHLHGARPRNLDAREITTCLTLAEIATEIVLTAATPQAANELSDEMMGARGMRDQIYQAQGMVAVELGISLTDALARMRAHAFSSGVDLASLAAALVSGRTHLPEHSDERS